MKMSRKISQLSCLFCVNSSISVKKFKITEEYGGGNTIRFDLTNFLGYQIESYLKDEDVLCSNCMNFFEHMAYTKRRLIEFLKDRDTTADAKMKGFNDIWKGFTKFAVTLVKVNPNDSNESWETENYLRPPTPNPLVYKNSEDYDDEYERFIMEQERRRSSSVTRSETGREVHEFFKRRKRGHNWSKRKGEQKSRALSRSYDSSRSSSRGRRRSVSSRCSSTTTMSGATSKRRKRIVEGRPLKTRSVSRVEQSYVEQMSQIEAQKFYCDDTDCPLYFHNLESFTLHRVLDHKVVARYNCSMCSNAYTTSKHLELHSKIHDGKMYCFQCGSELEGLQKFQEHVSDHQIYSVNCLYCLMSFLSKKDLAEHVSRNHKKEKVRAHEKSCKTLEAVAYKAETQKKKLQNSDRHQFKSIVLFNEGTPSPQVADVDLTSSPSVTPMPFSIESSQSTMTDFVSQAVQVEELDINDEIIQDTSMGDSSVMIIDESFEVTEVNSEIEENILAPEENVENIIEMSEIIIEPDEHEITVESIESESGFIELESNSTEPEDENIVAIEETTSARENAESIEVNNPIPEENFSIEQISETTETPALSIPRVLGVDEINEIILGNSESSAGASERVNVGDNWQLTNMRPVVVLERLNL